MESNAMKALLALLGVVALLPGACAIYFATFSQFDMFNLVIWAVCFLISGVGVVTLYLTFHKPGQPPAPP